MSERAPFQTRVSHFLAAKEGCDLPFAVGGATQHNPQAVLESHNSQDALSVAIEKSTIVAVVTDGCAGTHPKLQGRSRSSNEVGAKLLGYLTCREALRLTNAGAITSPKKFARELTVACRNTLESMALTFAGSDGPSQEVFVFDYLMATILGLAVTNKRFIIFYVGDGIIGQNNKLLTLKAQAGIYLANGIVLPRGQRKTASKFSINVFSAGLSRDINSIFLGSDGLYRLVEEYPGEVSAFVASRPPLNQVKHGFDFLLREFRQSLAWNPEIRLGLDDDATFALLRRIDDGVGSS